MREADHYRRRAEEAEVMARQMSREDHRRECLRLAEQWRLEAEAAERRAALGSPAGAWPAPRP